ncbi:hypothetical protein RND81_01G198700 [Saponaria officinalis]|uniref:C2 domain-containing protein n=1 Tax=Saponaria officinalis TaxID=3572 RepID=A0AAW1NB64_SAPOF
MCSSFPLEIKIRYVEGLTIGNKLIRKNVFVTVSTIDQIHARNQISTQLCNDDGETNPTWNEKLITTIPTDTKFILLDVRQKTTSKEKSIAVAKVPMSDFVHAYTPENYVHFLSYRLRDSHGEPNGIINFCVNIKGLSGHRYDHRNKPSEIHGCSYDTRNFNDVVVGVPVGWSNTWPR